VAADPKPYQPPNVVDGGMLPAALDLATRGTYSGHARQDDDALTHARAALLVSTAYIGAALLITLGLLLLAWLFRALGERFATYALVGLISWGGAVLWALWGNRRQSLWHSPTGIAHHELDMRECIARHAIDTHAALLLRQIEGRDK
jgi:hypothetical protein